MAILTKVRVPVSDIAKIIFGTSQVQIPSSGADINVTVSGNSIMDYQTTGAIFNAAKIFTAKQITGETVLLATAAGASANLSTTGTKGQLKTTSAHPLELAANSVVGATIGTDGKVTLGVQGTSGTHLVNKTYVDSVGGSFAAIVATLATTGQVSIPNSTGTNLIIKWGQTNGLGQLTQVTFGTAFPNAIYIAIACPVQNVFAGSDGQFGVYNLQLTGFQINQSNRGASTYPHTWLAIGS